MKSQVVDMTLKLVNRNLKKIFGEYCTSSIKIDIPIYACYDFLKIAANSNARSK